MRKLKTGENIGHLAKKKKINLHKLADEAGIPYNTLYSIVRRKSDKVELETVRKIALALDVHPIDVYGDDALELIDYGIDLAQRGLYSSLKDENLDKAMQAMQQATRSESSIENDFPVYIPDLSTDEYKLFNEIAENFEKLNAEGMKEAAKRIEELTQIPKYQRSETLSEDGEYTDTQKQEKPPKSLEKPLDGKK